MWKIAVDDWLLPSCCLLCESAAPGPVCEGCRADLPWNHTACPGCALPTASPDPCPACCARPRAFDAAWAAFRLQDAVRRSIHRLKYGAQFREVSWLAGTMAAALRARPGPRPDCLIPVPLHWRRQCRRGYNQAIELARPLGAELRMDVEPLAARRLRPTADQIGQRAHERRQSLRGAFEVEARVAGRHVALLDDVMTTGATLEALAQAARQAGAARIEAWAVARTPLQSP